MFFRIFYYNGIYGSATNIVYIKILAIQNLSTNYIEYLQRFLFCLRFYLNNNYRNYHKNFNYY